MVTQIVPSSVGLGAGGAPGGIQIGGDTAAPVVPQATGAPDAAAPPAPAPGEAPPPAGQNPEGAPIDLEDLNLVNSATLDIERRRLGGKWTLA